MKLRVSIMKHACFIPQMLDGLFVVPIEPFLQRFKHISAFESKVISEA
jgi:hypothetical protein